MHESEAIALWCGDITDQGINIDRGFYRGLYGPPKTEKSDRMVGVPDQIMERLRAWISRLLTTGPTDCVFPSETLVTPVWPENMLSRIFGRVYAQSASVGSILKRCGDAIPRSTKNVTPISRSSPTSKGTE